MTLRKHDRINRNYAASRTRCLRSELLECRNLLSVSPVQTAAEEVSPTAFFSFDAETIDGGTLYGGEIIEAGAVDKAISLDGVDDYFALEASEDLQIEGEITIAAWVKPESKTGVQDIIAHGYTRNPNAEVFLRISGGQYQIGSWNGSNHMISVNIPTSDIGSWVHLCGTYDGTHWRLYRNGELAGILEDSVGAVTVNADWTVGASMNGTDRFFHGVIDEVNIFDSAISEEMIADLAVRTADKPAGSWTALMDDDGLMYDSASDTTGQLRNGAEWAYDPEFGSVLDLTGNNGSVLLGDPESLQIEGKITLAAWVKPESTDGYNYILAKGFSQSPNGEICLRINDGKYEVGSWNGTSYYAAFEVPEEDLGTWVYLCGTYDGESWHLYRNGEEVAALQSTVGAISVNSDWSIGSTGNGTQRFFNGQIKQVQLYDTAVTAAQIADMYAAAPVPVFAESAAPVSFGGPEYGYTSDPYYLYFDTNGYSKTVFEIDWGDHTFHSYAFGDSEAATHVYSAPGNYTIRIVKVYTRGNKEQIIDVYGTNTQQVTIYAKPEIANNDFNFNLLDAETKQRIEDYTWSLGTVPGWSGFVEIRSDRVELDAHKQQPDSEDFKVGDGQQTSITTSPIALIPKQLYNLSFETSKRSNYAADNIVKVTVPGEILYAEITWYDGQETRTEWRSVESILEAKALGAFEPIENPFGLIDITSGSIEFSAGGNLYKISGSGSDAIGCTGCKVTSVIFQANTDSGTVSFANTHSEYDYISGYGPYLHRVDIEHYEAFANINADYENRNLTSSTGWKYRNNRLEEEMEDHTGYVIPMVSEDALSLASPYKVYVDTSCIDSRLYDFAKITITCSDPTVLQVPSIDMTVTKFLETYSDSSIEIHGLPNTANGTANVVMTLYIPETNVTYTDTVKVTTSLFILGDHTYYGQYLKSELNMNYMWACDLEKNTYKTPKSNGDSYRLNVQTGKKVGDSYLESALAYHDGFTMNYSYTFDRSYGENGDKYGYVQAKDSNGTSKGKKLSFVGNGGIKYGAESGSFEAAIFDVRAMVAMILGKEELLSADTFLLSQEDINLLKEKIEVIQDSKTGEYQIKVENYAPEPISKLLDAVGYGKLSYYTKEITDNEEKLALRTYPTDKDRIIALLQVHIQNTVNTVTIQAASCKSGKYGDIAISKGEHFYKTAENYDLPSSFNGKIYLQAHWGSGVIYQNINIE